MVCQARDDVGGRCSLLFSFKTGTVSVLTRRVVQQFEICAHKKSQDHDIATLTVTLIIFITDSDMGASATDREREREREKERERERERKS